MELVSTQPQSTILIGENYQTMLKESIDQFLNEIGRGISDFSGFVSIFFRLLHARVDPPLETIWFYSAVSFKTGIEKDDDDILTRVLRAKDLFQLLTTCSVSCNGLKSVAVISPVFYELWKVGFELLGKKGGSFSSKVEKKAVREIECLVEGVVSYVSICGCEDFGGNEDVDDLVTCFGDLVRVWTSDKAKGNVDVGESLKVFFPLVSEGIRDGLKGEVGAGYLAGVVIVQAFLLRLCLKVNAGAGLSKVVLQKELTSWAVGSITEFKNCCFFEILLRLLLESTLPVTSLLDSGDEAILRKVLCDAVILVDYSFLNNEAETVLTSHLMVRLSVTRLIVAHEAIQDARKNGDQTKAISYINAFSRSRLPSTLVKWATTQIGMEKEASKPNASTPQALFKWLLNLEQRGAKIFDNNAFKLRAKSAFDESKADFEQRVLQPYSQVEDDLLFYIDNKREEEEEKKDDQEMLESINDAFTTAANMMKFTANDERRKRKENRKSGDKSGLKFLKYNLHEHSVKKKKFLPCNAHSSESEEENPNVDEEMEELDG